MVVEADRAGNGRETLHKEIVVNDPLVTHGIRFYQSGYGQTGEVESLLLNATGNGESKQITLRPSQNSRPTPISIGIMVMPKVLPPQKLQ